jgi:DNA-binding NarL/FixJ family response regulator
MLVDDQVLFREALRTLLSLHADLAVVGEAGDGHEALRLAPLVRPDVALMDMKMPGMDGVAATRRLRVAMPPCQVVALTTFDDDEYVFEGLRAGAVGYLLKDAPSERLVEAIRTAARGESLLHPSVATKLVAEIARQARPASPSSSGTTLSEREAEVLRLLARGASNKEIAAGLALAHGTVKNHVTSILTKLAVAGRTEAALRARELGIV